MLRSNASVHVIFPNPTAAVLFRQLTPTYRAVYATWSVGSVWCFVSEWRRKSFLYRKRRLHCKHGRCGSCCFVCLLLARQVENMQLQKSRVLTSIDVVPRILLDRKCTGWLDHPQASDDRPGLQHPRQLGYLCLHFLVAVVMSVQGCVSLLHGQ
jgi:hypothetical protein